MPNANQSVSTTLDPEKEHSGYWTI